MRRKGIEKCPIGNCPSKNMYRAKKLLFSCPEQAKMRFLVPMKANVIYLLFIQPPVVVQVGDLGVRLDFDGGVGIDKASHSTSVVAKVATIPLE